MKDVRAQIDFDPREMAELIEKLPQALPFLEKLVAVGRSYAGKIMQVPQRGIRQVKITFTNSRVEVDGEKPRNKNVSLFFAECLIVKRKAIHWLWTYVMLPKFEVKKKTPDEQFRNYISKEKKWLANRGIHITTIKEKYCDGAAVFEGVDDCVVSNIKIVRTKYEQALSQYEAGDITRAIETLSPIANDAENRWYTFTDAYMALAKWILQMNFRGVSEKLTEKCRDFFQWYVKRLRVGILEIEQHRQQKGLSGVSLDVFENIKRELEEASKLYTALVERVPLDQEEQSYRDFVDFLVRARENLLSVNGKDENSEMAEKNLIEHLKSLAKENKHLAQIIDYGKDALDKILDARYERHKYAKEYIQDLQEDVHWQMGELILQLENFDRFEMNKGNKLQCLKTYLCSCLEKILRQRYGQKML